MLLVKTKPIKVVILTQWKCFKTLFQFQLFQTQLKILQRELLQKEKAEKLRVWKMQTVHFSMEMFSLKKKKSPNSVRDLIL